MVDQTSKPLVGLFPAYSADVPAFAQPVKSDESWLRNDSFIPKEDLSVDVPTDGCRSSSISLDDTARHEEGELSIGMKRSYVLSEESSNEEIIIEKRQFSHHKKKKKKKKKKLKKKHRENDEERLPSASPEVPGQIPAISGKVFLEDIPDQKGVVTFSVDKSQDRNNYIYGSVYRMNVAERHALRGCLGTGGGEFHKRNDVNKVRRYYQIRKKKIKKLDADGKNVEDEMELPVLDADEDEVIEANTRGEIPVMGDFMPLCVTADGCVDTRPSSRGETRAQYIKRRTEEYNRHLARKPNDIEMWLEFINFQEEYFKDGGDLGIGKNLRESERLKRQESLIFQAKQAIFERGIKENPQCVKLKVEQLLLCQNYWEHTVLLKEWKQLVFTYPNNLDVWQQYLTFTESNIAKFTISGLRKAYKKCINVLKGIYQSQVKSHPPKPGTMEFIIETFVRLCYRLRQAGHCRAAVGLFQGTLEYNLFFPADLRSKPHSLQMEYWTAFWESNAPHIGDLGATGWAQWVQNKGKGVAYVPWTSKVELEAKEDSLLQTHTSKWLLWRALETNRANHNWLPWRPDIQAGETTDSCEDPDGLVLSDDITEALVTMETDLQKLQLLCEFLEFLGIPDASFRTTPQSQLGPSVILENISHIQQFGDLIEGSNLEEFQYFRQWEFVGNVIKQTMSLFEENMCLRAKMVVVYRQFLEESLRHETDSENTTHRMNQVRTEAKSLLESLPYRNDMLSWQQYALLECHLGNLNTARKVLNTTISGLAPDVEKIPNNAYFRSIAVLLYRTYAEIELGLVGSIVSNDVTKKGKNSGNQPSQALAVLASLCEDSFSIPAQNFSLSSTQVIKYQRLFENQVTSLITDMCKQQTNEEVLWKQTVGSCVEHWIVCAELFAYMTSGLEAAISVYQSVCRHDSIDTVTSERLTKTHLQLLQRHAHCHSCPLAVIRSPLLQAVEVFPHNIHFLADLVTLELRSSFSGHALRQQMSHQCRSRQANATTWILAVLAERSKVMKLEGSSPQSPVLPSVGRVHAIRTWFERAVVAVRARNCVLLWRMYLLFEMECGQLDNAKRVFYRSIQQCPWAKWLYLDYYKTAPPSSTQEILDLMLEKELGLHTLAEEVDLLMETSETHTPPHSPPTHPATPPYQHGSPQT